MRIFKSFAGLDSKPNPRISRSASEMDVLFTWPFEDIVYLNRRPANTAIIVATVNVLVENTNLWKLFGNVSSDKHSFQINPQVLHCHPLLNDFCCSTQLVDPKLNFRFKRNVIPIKKHICANSKIQRIM